MRTADHYTIISADCHAGGSHEMYREYLDPDVRRRLRRLAREVQEPVPRPAGRRPGPQLGRRPPHRRPRGRRHRRRGRVPQHRAARSSRASSSSPAPPTPDEYEHRLAGIRAHNRWMADCCARFPERRAGIGQIFLNDVDDAIEGRPVDQGARPARRRAHLVDPARRRLREAAVRPGVRPAVGAVRGPRRPGEQPRRHRAARTTASTRPRALLFITEVQFYSQRPFVQLLFSGVFERFPKLKFVMTEMGCAWMPPMLKQLRRACSSRSARPVAPARCATPRSTSCRSRPPSTSARTAGWASASPVAATPPRSTRSASTGSCGGATTRTTRARARSRASTCGSCSTTPTRDRLQQMLAGNAAELYGFDLDALRPLAEKVGPTVGEIARAARPAAREPERGAAARLTLC